MWFEQAQEQEQDGKLCKSNIQASNSHTHLPILSKVISLRPKCVNELVIKGSGRKLRLASTYQKEYVVRAAYLCELSILSFGNIPDGNTTTMVNHKEHAFDKHNEKYLKPLIRALIRRTSAEGSTSSDGMEAGGKAYPC